MDVSSNLRNCRICPRQCGVNRLENASGYCRSGKLPMISSICIHHGEEPAISGEKGICNVFFAHCNLRCVYCQNHQISRNNVAKAGTELSIDEAAKQIAAFLDQGIDRVGFVSPTHFSVQMTQIVDALHDAGYFPTIVYNSNGYDNVDTLRQLSDYVDVYLPDLKYCCREIARKYSDADDYADVAKKAIKEMVRQKGSALKLDSEGLARSGVIIRHLVLPGATENSKAVLRFIAELDPKLHISLMSQYYPPFRMPFDALNRKVSADEYEALLELLETLELENGWVQELESSECYQPDFEIENPFDLK